MKRGFYIFLIFLVLLGCKRPQRAHDATTQSNNNSHSNRETEVTQKPENRDWKNTTTVKMSEYGGVYEIPIKINGTEMDIIFDTGASSISISETELYFLIKQGKISKEDFLGKAKFTDATGNVSEGTRINLKSVKIGNREVYNVEASVVPNMTAPLLLGQTALRKFGNFSINYQTNTIRFE